MRIGVISDTHGSLYAWQKALDGPLSDVDLLLHAGDVLYHGPRNPLPEGYQPAALAEAINSCRVPLLIAKGNCDSEVDQMVIDHPIQSPYVMAQTELGRIIITHGHRESREQAREVARKYQVDIWISGHTHIPGIEQEDGIIFLNPGSVCLPKGEILHPSVALITESDIALYDIVTEDVHSVFSREKRESWKQED